jgi:hypothetical protein
LAARVPEWNNLLICDSSLILKCIENKLAKGIVENLIAPIENVNV